MREILFRGKRRDNGKWVYGHYRFVSIEDCGFHHEIWVDYYLNKNDEWEPSSGNEEDWGYSETVEPETIGQYTGLKDKNGNKIFEGDIVRYNDAQTYEVYFSCEFDWRDYSVCSAAFCLKDKSGFLKDICWISRTYDFAEVIGNIHDNPELLEKTR